MKIIKKCVFPLEKHRAESNENDLLRPLGRIGSNLKGINRVFWSKIHSVCINIYMWAFLDRINGDWIIGLKEVRRGKIIVRNIGDSIMSMSKRTQKTLCVSSV